MVYLSYSTGTTGASDTTVTTEAYRLSMLERMCLYDPRAQTEDNETMSLTRTQSSLAAWILVLLTAAPVFAAHPVGVDDMQPFAPADLSMYGGGYRANEGFFFSFDVMNWWIEKPDVSLIGDPTTRDVVISASRFIDHDGDEGIDLNGDGVIDANDNPTPRVAVDEVRSAEFSTHDTGPYRAQETPGQRYDFGYVEGHHGLLCSIYQLGEQNQSFMASDAHVVFQDSPFGVRPDFHLQGFIDSNLEVVDNLPVRFDYLEASYQVRTWGAEMNYLRRMHPFHHGGILEIFFGARYLQFDDSFFVEGTEIIPVDGDPASGLGDSAWYTEAENRIVGPQVGFRWYRKCNRWTWSTEGRAFAGFNSQGVTQWGILGSNLDPENAGLFQIRNMAPTSFNHARNFNEFSPAAELRIDLKYQATRSITLGAGWTAIWMENIARSPGMIDYAIAQDSVMGITGYNTQSVYMHGVSGRIEFNR